MDGRLTYTTQVFTQTLASDTKQFYIDIYCPFIPETINFSNLVSTIPALSVDDNVYVLSSNLVSSLDNVIGIFQPNNNTMSTDISFQNTKPVSGRFTFTLDEPILNGDTVLSFTMKFMKLQ
jgi:hypothetical protein